MNVCLITPPSPFLLDQRVFVSLGILKVAAMLEKCGHKVEHLDLSGVENYITIAVAFAMHTKTQVFGLTATTPQMLQASAIAQSLRAVRPDARIILGGPHATLVHAAAKKGNVRVRKAMNQLEEAFDVIVAGDGEDAILQAIRPEAPHLIDADDPKSSLFMTSKRLEETPWPARHLVEMKSYHYTVDGVRATSLIAQLGCPFACAFCGGRESAMLRRIRTRTTANIIAEIRHLHDKYGVRGFMFYDDELNVNKQVVELMHAIGDLNLDLRLRGFVKAELFTDEQAEAMYRAGFRWLLCGFESGSPRILEAINKKATAEDNTRCLRIAHKHGIKIKALMSIGHAGESAETICETKEWLLAEKPDDFDATVITVYPGTPYHDRAVKTAPGVWTFTAKSGDKLHARETDFFTEASFYKGIPGSYKSFVWTDYITADEIVRLRDDLENTVRAKLGIPFNAGAPGIMYESSMGQIPSSIFRVSA